MKEEKSTLKRLKLLPGLFRKQDAEKLTSHAGMFLSGAIKKGLIHRINRGNYVNSFLYGFPRVEEVACFLRPPAYISCEWALNYHGVSLQSPIVCTVVTLSKSVGKKPNIRYRGITIEFSNISPSLFFGFTYHNRFYMAFPKRPCWTPCITAVLSLPRMNWNSTGQILMCFQKWLKCNPKSVRRSLLAISDSYDFLWFR